ncbi:MAG: SusC/RagA family TonB-linked outer membrane protein, partial [Mangrovibacterium sp.]
SRTDPVKYALYTYPFGDPYDEKGNVNTYPVSGNTGIFSPLADEAPGDIAVDNETRTNNLINGYLELTPLKGLSLKSNLAVNLSSTKEGSYYDSLSLAKQGGESESTYTSTTSRFINWDNILTYDKGVGDHLFKLTALTSYIRSTYEYVEASGQGQLIASQLYYSLQGNDTDTKQTYSGYEKYTNFSVAGRVNYSFKDKYLLTMSLRYDGASRLAEGNRWDSFPSVAIGWRVSEEGFMQHIDVISNLKLRASYGVAGNSSIDPYGTQSSMSLHTDFSFGDDTAPYYTIDRYSNSDLGWEKSKTRNIGLDLGFFDNRINLTTDVYKTKTSDVLLSRTLPWSAGGKNKTVYQNIGKTENKGIELSINSINLNKKNFKWTSNLTFTSSSEEITRLINDQDIINGGKTTSLIIGEPMNTWYNYVSDGIWQSGDEDEMARFNENGHNFQAGDIKVKDLNGDYIIDGTNDRQAIGHSNPDWEGGLQNTFEYKNFDFSFYIYARRGQNVWGEFLGRYNPDGEGNGPAFINYWTPENPSNDYPRPDANKSSISQYTYSDVLMLADGSYIKLRNVTLGYTLPKSLLNRTPINKIRIYVTGSNLFTWAKDSRFKHYDPERGGSESSPLARQIIFGVNVDF